MSRRQGLFKLAFKNIKNYAWINIKVCFAFSSLAFLVCLFTLYNRGLSGRRDMLFAENASANYVSFKQSNKAAMAFCDENLVTAEEYSYKVAVFCKRVGKVQGIPTPQSLEAKYLSVELDGAERLSSSDSAKCSFFTREVFSKYDIAEAKARFGMDTPLIGNLPGKGEVAVGYYFANAFNITEKDIGKKITVSIIKDSAPIFEGTVSGFMRKEFYELSGHGSVGGFGLIVDESFEGFNESDSYTRNIRYLAEWPDIETIALLKQAGGAYEGSDVLNLVRNVDRLRILGNSLYIIIGSGLMAALILTVMMMVGKYVNVFSRSGGILLTSGLERRRLYLLLLLQLGIICLISVPVALAMTFVGYYAINYIVGAFKSGLVLSITSQSLVSTFALGIAVVGVSAIVFFAFALLKIRKKTVKELLTAIRQ